MFSELSERPRLSPHTGSTLRFPALGLDLESVDLAREEIQTRLERIEVSDGTVGWKVIRSGGGATLGDVIRITRVRPGGRPRFSYYGKKAARYFGKEFRAKSQAVEYIMGPD